MVGSTLPQRITQDGTKDKDSTAPLDFSSFEKRKAKKSPARRDNIALPLVCLAGGRRHEK
jgi:hypothetical protein